LIQLTIRVQVSWSTLQFIEVAAIGSGIGSTTTWQQVGPLAGDRPLLSGSTQIVGVPGRSRVVVQLVAVPGSDATGAMVPGSAPIEMRIASTSPS
jgi:hypothetical protein